MAKNSDKLTTERELSGNSHGSPNPVIRGNRLTLAILKSRDLIRPLLLERVQARQRTHVGRLSVEPKAELGPLHASYHWFIQQCAGMRGDATRRAADNIVNIMDRTA